MDSKPIQAITYHEAGHAVAAAAKGIDFEYVSIQIEEGVDPGLRFPAIDELEIESWTQGVRTEYIRNRVFVLMAGPIGQELFTGEYDHQGATKDHDEIYWLTRRLIISLDLPITESQQNMIRNAIRKEVRVFFDDELRKAQVGAVAEALLVKTTLSQSEVYCILTQEERSR